MEDKNLDNTKTGQQVALKHSLQYHLFHSEGGHRLLNGRSEEEGSFPHRLLDNQIYFYNHRICSLLAIRENAGSGNIALASL